MKKYLFISLGIIVLGIICGFVWKHQKTKKVHGSQNIKQTMYYNGKYKKNWKEIDSLLRINQTKTALTKVEEVMKITDKKGEHGEWVRALMFKMQTTSQYEENYINQHISEIKGYAKTKPAPVKQVLHSFLSTLYWNYYKNNSWKIHKRSTTADFKNDDIETWDYEKFVLACHENYQLSLQNPELLQKTSVKEYEAILNSGNSINLRPALYDFLVHRAIDFYRSTEVDLNAAKNQFKLDDPTYLQSAKSYTELTLPTVKEFSYKYESAKLLQELLAFRLESGDLHALVDADLKRIDFVYDHAIFSDKDKYYLEALEAIANNGHSSSARGHYRIAKYHFKKSNYVKAFEICEATMKEYPKSYGGANCKALKNDILKKSIDFNVEETFLPNKTILTQIKHRNVNKIFIKVIPTDKEELEDISFYDKELNALKNFSKAKTYSFDLPTYTDYKSHSTEIKLPAQTAGQYIFAVSSAQDFKKTKQYVAYAHVNITDVSIINQTHDEYQEFFVISRETGLPLANKKVEIYEEEYSRIRRAYVFDKQKTTKTDSKGYLKIPRKVKGNSIYLKVFNTDKDIYWNPRSYNTYINSRYHRSNDIRTHLFTDRKIYRPSQTVYFKGIVVEYDAKSHQRRKVVANTTMMVTLRDPNYQTVETLNVKTNEYGAYSGSFTLPTGRLNGTYRIQDIYGGNHSFRVEEYKRPTFETNINPIEGQFRLNDEIEVKGNAKAFSGAVVDQAKVSYSIIRTVRYPYWQYGWWRPVPSSPSTTIINAETITDDKGEFKFNFKAIPDDRASLKNDPVFNYKISVDVTDLNGETRSATYSVSVSNKALQLGLNMPSELEKVSKKKFKISTTNLQGQSITAKGNLLIERLETPTKVIKERIWGKPEKILMSQEEFEKDFAFAYGDDENRAVWKTKKQVLKTDFNTKKSTEIELKAFNKTGVYRITLEAKDSYGENVKLVKYVTVFDSDAKELVLPTNFSIKPIKDYVEPNENAELLIGSSHKVRVLYEIEHNKKIVHREWVKLDNEQKKISIPVKEEYRGNFITRFITIHNNRVYSQSNSIVVPYSNKELDISFETFRDKLQPGEKEQWKLKIKGKNGDKVGAEFVATLYDASLDEFATNYWNLSVYSTYYARYSWNHHTFSSKAYGYGLTRNWNPRVYKRSNSYYKLDWNGYETYYHTYKDYENDEVMYLEEAVMDSAPAELVNQSVSAAAPAGKRMARKAKKEKQIVASVAVTEEVQSVAITLDKKVEKKDNTNNDSSTPQPIKTRTNFNETAFFFPHLETDEEGAIIVNFTVPESLTKWKMLGLGHTKDLKIGTIQNELVTQKDLMITANAPRFFRENDIIYFTAKVNNLSDKTLKGTANLALMDARSNKNIDNLLGNKTNNQSFEVKAGQSTVVTWKFKVSDEVQAITYKVTARAGNFTDGEQKTLPVLSNRMLVTETMPLWIRGNQTKTFNFKNFEKAKSSTLKHHQYTLEFTANPTWYAVQALPYLMEYPYECAEQTFSRLYANSISSHIVDQHPAIKEVFEKWKTLSPDALLSNLEKNQELKSVLLQETPWVLQAKDESARKRRIAVLFDINRMANEEARAIQRLEQLQLGSGGWPWFKGMREDRYVTQHIVTGAGKLRKMGVDNPKMTSMAKEAILYLDEQLLEDYEWLKKNYKEKERTKKHIGYTQIHYLYMRSFFPEVKLKSKFKEAYDYYFNQAQQFWASESRYMQGMIALTLDRNKVEKIPQLIVRGLQENSLYSEEMGMYWKETYGYYWYQAPIETHALMIEVFDEVAKDPKAVENLKIWLLKNKQTNDWKTTKATVEACYVLLSKGSDWLANNELPSIEVGNYEIAYKGQAQKTKKTPQNVTVEAGTGYFKTTWEGKEVDKSMGEIKVKNPNASIAWGGVYWQYFEQLDKIKASETPLSLKKQLFVERKTEDKVTIVPVTEKTVLKRGDRIKVRIELRVDRAMEYVHMKDMRASGFEPENVLSQYKYQGGLGYYESTKDASTNFFISYLPKGTFVFEYPLRVTHAGDFSNGITSIQCMYAPEFSSHSEGIRVNIKK
ncbi:MAG: hypothetical protein GY827_04290 [Cytophagales bacterium]|nr:hypothetical protein [Cytophagales bacterium]